MIILNAKLMLLSRGNARMVNHYAKPKHDLISHEARYRVERKTERLSPTEDPEYSAMPIEKSSEKDSLFVANGVFPSRDRDT